MVRSGISLQRPQPAKLNGQIITSARGMYIDISQVPKTNSTFGQNFALCQPSGSNIIDTRLFYKEPTSRLSSKSSFFVDVKSANCSTKSSLIVP